MISATPVEISVIIVNYGTPELAINAVESVLSRHHGGRIVDVHLVDNNSPGNDADHFRQAHKTRNWEDRVTLYLEDTNHGFGRGNNVVLNALAARPAPPATVMLLNPDAELENEAISLQADFLDTHSDHAVVGPAITKPDGTKVTSAFRFPNAAAEFARAVNFGPISRLFRNRTVALSPEYASSEVDWVAGAAPLIRFKALQKAGFFDPAYFLYFEEVDLMRQITNQGGKIGYLPEARVVHVEGAATNVRSNSQTPKRTPAFWYHSWAHYYLKNHGRGGAMLAAVAWCSGAAMNCIIAPLRRQQPSTPQRFFRDFWAVAGREILGLKAKDYA